MSPKILRYRVPIAALSKHVHPLDGRLWGCDEILPSDVASAVENARFEDRPWDIVKDELQGPGSRDFHITRIAHFVGHGLPNDKHSIQLTLDEQPDGSLIGIGNGNHRIAAAQIRQDQYIEALLYVFDESDIERLLPGAMQI